MSLVEGRENRGPMDEELAYLSVAEMSALIQEKMVSPVEIVKAILSRIDALDSRLKSYITVCADTALAEAEEAESEIGKGEYRGPLHGIPISHKDISLTRGVRTTAHSRVLLDFIPAEDATHVSRLRGSGMILLGKTNLTEFACGAMELFGVPQNPWNLEYYAGGSSGGSASALAAGLAIAATGTDTGGSIRVPASFCGIVGLRPTFGRVSRFGVFPVSWSMDQVGPMARTVTDCALLMSVMAGLDQRDPTTAAVPVPNFTSSLDKGLHGVVLGVPQKYFLEGLAPDIEAAFRETLIMFEELGAKVEPINMPHACDLYPVMEVIMMVEAFGEHAATLRRHYTDYATKTRRRLASGAFYTAADYQHALRIRALWIKDVRSALSSVDALLTPTVPTTAFTVKAQLDVPPDCGQFTRPFSLSGNPALSLPCGFSKNGLPIGLQIVGRPFDEPLLFQVGAGYEMATSWHKKRAPLEGRA
jgi:aspartyl-tRNA(Asn)/glutamyl-tRNA(Gln) amidotransferase subunit A